MKSFIVFALLAAAALAAPPPSQYSGNEKDAVVEVNDLDNIGVGDFTSRVKTSNGIQSESQGTLEKVNNEGDVASVLRGAYSYTAPDGQVISVTWTADQNGFHPEGAHIPK